MSKTFKTGSQAGHFFISILFWGIAAGCFSAVLNNYLAEMRKMDQLQRGILEFFREMPGLFLVFIIALMHKYTDWKILKIGTLIALLGIIGLIMSPDNKIVITALIMIWSTGEHILMPVRSSIAMNIAKNNKIGRSLGMVTGITNAGTVAGSALSALVFLYAPRFWHIKSEMILYNAIWYFIIFLLSCSIFYLLLAKPANDNQTSNRPTLYFNRKYNKFYALELFYGARKQIFITFAPYVLILQYHTSTWRMAVLLGICSLVNFFCAPLIGKLTDRIGYKNIMIYDTVILFFVCIIYGYADKFFSQQTAIIVVYLNYLLDAIISTTSMATNMYVKEISATKQETTSTLTTGISINHLISIIVAPLGGLIWSRLGFGTLFIFAAVMALANSAFAMTLPMPRKMLLKEKFHRQTVEK